jgi:DHA1 family bicyclomycin/chloramphenicol resistance-like MFS transporter
MSDRFGRRPVLLVGLAIYFLSCILCFFAWDIDVLIAGRFVMGLGACSGPVLARAIVRDIFGRERSARMLSYMGTVMGVIPAVSPLLGGYLTGTFGWAANFAFLGLFSAAALLGSLLLLHETNQWRDPQALQVRRLAGAYRTLLGHRAFMAYTMAVTFGFAAFTAYITNIAYVLVDQLGVPVEDFGYYFAIVVAGFMSGTIVGGRLTTRLGIPRITLIGIVVLVAAAAVGAALALGGAVSLLTVIGPAAAMLHGIGLIFPNGIAGAIGPFHRMAGTASALLGFIQMATGAAVATVTASLYDGTTVPMALGILASSLICLALFLALGRGHETAPTAAA